MTSNTLTLYQNQDSNLIPAEYQFTFQVYDFDGDTDSQRTSYNYWLKHPEGCKVITLDAEEGVNG